MKNDREFLESIYTKQQNKLKQYKKNAVIITTTVLTLALITGAVLFTLNKGDEGKEHINESLIITLPNESAESSDGEAIKDKPLENLVLLSCPVKISTEVTTKPVDDKLSVITFTENIKEDGYYYTPKLFYHNNYKTLVAIEVNPLTSLAYKGTPLSEIFKITGYGYIFKDQEYEIFNEFQAEFYRWDNNNGAELKKAELERKAKNGDKTAAEKLELYKDADNETLFYYLVWGADKTAEEISKLNRQRTEFNHIWKLYENTEKDVLITNYKDEIESLISEGYDLSFVTVDGTVKLVGVLNAEQAEYFNKDQRFNYTSVWVKCSYEDKYDLIFAGSEEVIEVPKRKQ